MPRSRPMRTTEPSRSSSSLGLPAQRSRVQLVVAPAACRRTSTRLSSHASSYFRPWLRASAMISCMAPRHNCWSSGVLATTSCVAEGPLLAWTPVVAQIKANFSQILDMASTSMWPAMPLQASNTAFTWTVFGEGSPSNSPKVMYGGLAAQWRIMPGSWIAETMLQQPAKARPRPQEVTMDLIRSKPSTPFCSGRIRVPGPHQGLQRRRQRSASQALQPSTMTSASKGSSVLLRLASGSAHASPRLPVSMSVPSFSGGTVRSPQMLLTRTPCFCRAASA
mmetsp:Transcript_39952/g.114173  ORF Transcript_39952/g.114173 Transcript_39952/m.114173 type:complete len:279 (+) Transcript_39952:821-1657(+)